MHINGSSLQWCAASVTSECALYQEALQVTGKAHLHAAHSCLQTLRALQLV